VCVCVCVCVCVYVCVCVCVCGCSTDRVPPVCVEPALGAGPHVTVLGGAGLQVHVALLVRNKVPDVADAVHLPGPLAQTAGHRALWAGDTPHAVMVTTHSLSVSVYRCTPLYVQSHKS